MAEQSLARAISKMNIISPKKVRRISKVIDKMQAQRAIETLDYLKQRGASMLKKTINSAVFNGINGDLGGDLRDYYIKEIQINPGPIIKRRSIRARGRADLVKKRTSHIRVVVELKEKGADNGSES